MNPEQNNLRAAVYTLGCKLNQCESEALASSFDSRGFFIASTSENASVYIINTCTVTSKAEQKARRMIRKLSKEHPESVVLVTGCYAQLEAEALSLGPNVVVVPHDRKNDINELPAYLESTGIITADSVKEFFRIKKTETEPAVTKPEHPDPDRFWYESVDFSYHTRAYLKIQDGCDNSCAYCRVTIARGDSVSLDVDRVTEQFEALAGKKYREIILTGVNLTSYESRGVDFSGLLSILAPAAERAGVRIRLSSLEPETIDDRMAAAVSSPAVCPHFHIPVQSGSDNILAAMRRHNNREKIISAVKTLRSVKDDPFLAADVIAGFPGETDDDFEQTRSLLEQLGFAHLHVFPFSPRPGTAAAVMKNPVPQRIAGERTTILRKLSNENYRKYAERWLGREVDILLEEKKGEFWYGISENYLKTQVCDILEEEHDMCRTVIEEFKNEHLKCKFIQWI